MSDEDCTEVNLTSLLGVISVLGPGDRKEAEQVAGQVITITRRLVLGAEEEERRLTLSNITGCKDEGREGVVNRVHKFLLEHLDKSECGQPEIIGLLASSNNMTALTLRHFLTKNRFSDSDFKIFQFLKDSNKDKIEVDQNTVLRLEEILCTRYHSISSEEHLVSLTRLLSGLLDVNNVRRKFLENRSLLVQGEDGLHSYEGCSVEDLGTILECEMSVETGGDKRDLVETTLAMSSPVLRGSGGSDQVCIRLLDKACGVWAYKNRRRGEANENSSLKDTIVMLESLMKIFDKKANWRKVYRQCEDRYEEIRLIIWNMVSDPFLEKGDLTDLLETCKHENNLCLSLEATKLVLKHTALSPVCDIILVSEGYWFARGRISSSREKILDRTFLDWKSGRWDNPQLARLGLVLLGEQLLEGSDAFTHNANNSVLRKLESILSAGESVEAALTSSPRDWWGPELMSEKLATVVSLVLLKIYTNTIPNIVTRPSPRFTVTVLLPRLSSILLSPAIPDIDISIVMTKLMDIINSISRNKVSSLLQSVYQNLQPDLKAVLRSYQ